MLKKIAVLAAFFIYSVVFSQQVLALEVTVSEGVVSIYKDSVLGVSDEEKTRETTQKQNRERILNRQEQTIRVEKKDKTTEIELRPTIKSARENIEKIERIEADRLEMEFEPSVREESEDMDEARTTRIEQVRRERVERKTESDQVKLESRDRDGEHRLELESRQVRARIPEGLQFELNSETNEVTLTSPTGVQKTLNHLPDQAIARMQEVGLFTPSDSDSIEVSVNSDTQQVEYRQKALVTKRLLGFFKRDVTTEVILNDETGEVREEETATGFTKFLNSLSI